MKRRTLEEYQRDKRLKLATADGVTLSNTMTIDDRIERINQCWKKTNTDYVAGIIEVGQELIEAQQEHGKSLRKMAEKLPFSWSQACQLMVIARRLFTSGKHSLLPPSWRTLYELAQLPEHIMEQALKDGRINPNMTRAEAKVLKPAKKSHKATTSNGEKRIDKAIELVRERIEAGEPVQSKELGKPHGISHNIIETAVHVVRKIDEAKRQWRREKPNSEKLLTIEELRDCVAKQWGEAPKEERKVIVRKLIKALGLNIHDFIITMQSPLVSKRKK